jgi:glyoxylase-like metal-dependent hydrolase (beta-lactamase superfamily II)
VRSGPHALGEPWRNSRRTREARRLVRMPAEHHLLHAGYVRDGGVSVASSVSLVTDGEAVIVVDPGMVESRAAILQPLAALGLTPEDVTHVVITHHHPDHAMNAALFANAELVDAWARYRGDQWLDHDGDGHRVSQNTWIISSPGHTQEDLTFMADTDAGVVACTHAWWHTDRTPEIDPGAEDTQALEVSRRRILAEADIVVPGHGEPFPTGRSG